MSLFHHNIKTLRVSWRLNQTELGAKFGMSQSAYQKWEDGTEPSYDTLVQVAKFFRMSIDDLLSKEIELVDVPKRYAVQGETTEGNILEELAVMYERSQGRSVALVDFTALVVMVEDLKERMERLESK